MISLIRAGQQAAEPHRRKCRITPTKHRRRGNARVPSSEEKGDPCNGNFTVIVTMASHVVAKVGNNESPGGVGSILRLGVAPRFRRMRDQQPSRRKRYMSRKASRNKSRNRSRIKRLRPLAGLLAAGLSLPGAPAPSRHRTRPMSPARSRTARGSSAMARLSRQPAPKSTSASGSAPRPLR